MEEARHGVCRRAFCASVSVYLGAGTIISDRN